VWQTNWLPQGNTDLAVVMVLWCSQGLPAVFMVLAHKTHLPMIGFVAYAALVGGLGAFILSTNWIDP